MIDLEIDTSELLKWARYLSTIPRKTGPAIARALNTVGDNAVKTATAYIADQMGFDPDDVSDMIIVKRASPDDLSFEIDMSKIIGSGESRSWDSRDDSSSSFEQNTLVKIVTSGDEKVCQKCLDAADNSPYTLEEVNSINPLGPMDPTGERTEIVHPLCRCMVQNWQATRQLPVRLSGVGGNSAPPELFTMRQLGQAIAGELEVVIKAI